MVLRRANVRVVAEEAAERRGYAHDADEAEEAQEREVGCLAVRCEQQDVGQYAENDYDKVEGVERLREIRERTRAHRKAANRHFARKEGEKADCWA